MVTLCCWGVLWSRPYFSIRPSGLWIFFVRVHFLIWKGFISFEWLPGPGRAAHDCRLLSGLFLESKTLNPDERVEKGRCVAFFFGASGLFWFRFFRGFNCVVRRFNLNKTSACCYHFMVELLHSKTIWFLGAPLRQKFIHTDSLFWFESTWRGWKIR